MTEATDAFGTIVGREEIGLYTASRARGFSPQQAGNLRIDGLYFDQATQLGTRLVRSSTVHVGISAQGFPFPAPTGVVDYHLRIPGEAYAGSALIGYRGYGQTYSEVDVQAPIGGEKFSVGGGFAYVNKSSVNYSPTSWDWDGGVIAHWRPNDSVTITPFWSIRKHNELGERAQAYVGPTSGLPHYRYVDVPVQGRITFGIGGSNIGATAQWILADGLTWATGVFHSTNISDANNTVAFLNNITAQGEGDYNILGSPRAKNTSTSGETRLTKAFNSETIHSTVYLSVKARDAHNEFGGSDRIAYGRATITSISQVGPPPFKFGPTTHASARHITPALAYEGLWRDVGQLSLGVQKAFYRRATAAPNAAIVGSSISPWLYNVSGAGYITDKIAVYASYTRGFEEVGSAPSSATNRGESVPAQLTSQVDAGVKVQILPRLQFVGGVFKIQKPYFNSDAVNFYRRIGTTSNKGAEFSLAGSLTERLTVVAGVTLIDPKVANDAAAGGPITTVAVGPIPAFGRVNFQYRLPWVQGLSLDTRIERMSKRYATTTGLRLPSFTKMDAGLRYTTLLFGKNVTARIQGTNLADAYGWEIQASGQLPTIDGRRVELSLALDF